MSIIPNICSAISSVTLTRTRFNKAINQTLTRRGRPFGAELGWLGSGHGATEGSPEPAGDTRVGTSRRARSGPAPQRSGVSTSATGGDRGGGGIRGGGEEGRGRTAALPVGAPSVAESDAPRRAVGTPSGGEGVNGPGPTQQKENFIMK